MEVLGGVGRRGDPVLPVEAIQAVDGLLLGPAPLVGGLQVAQGELGQGDPQGRGPRPGARPGGVDAETVLGPRVIPEAPPGPRPPLVVLAVRVEQERGVAPLRLQHGPGQHLHEVRLPHPGGGEDAQVGHEGVPADPDLQVDRVLARAQQADPQVAHARREERQILGGGGGDPGELGREGLGLAELPAPVDVAEGRATSHLVQALLAIVQLVGRLGRIAGHEGAGRALRPVGIGGVRAVGDVDHAEQEPAAALRVLGGQQLPEEQVGAVVGPEGGLQHALPEDPAPVHLSSC